MTIIPKKLVVIGDSGVLGWGDTKGGGWCERLRCRWMKDVKAPVIYPLGVRGDGIERVASRWKREWQIRGELRRQMPDGILLAIGLNDTARIGREDGRAQLDIEAYRFGLKQLLKEIREETEVLVMGITPVNETAMPYAGCLWYSNKSISNYEAQIEAACLEKDVPFLPIHQSMLSTKNWKKFIAEDGLHLNSKGHEWIYKKVLEWSTLEQWAASERIN